MSPTSHISLGCGADSQSAASRLVSTQENRLDTSVEAASKSACATKGAS
jgi:hypothetical protein